MPSIRRRGGQAVDDGLDLITDGLAEPESRVIVNSGSPAAGPGAKPGLPPDLLNAPVGMDDDLAHALAARPPRRKLPGATAFLGAAVLVAGGFLGGVLTQKHQGGTSTGAGGNAAAVAAAFRNRGGTGTGAAAAGGTGGAAAGANGTTLGTVKLVDGNTIYLTATDGSIIRVTTGSGTTIKVTKNGAASDLAPGTAVVVQGTPDASGVVKATTVTEAGGGTGGGGFGGARTRTGTGTGAATGGNAGG
ncbi:MAG: hypothetical protein QOJ11_2904 [Frankiales bacterium]|jgi:hypothetical protein|nr:hypothetical protein [Frankiales bacterium]